MANEFDFFPLYYLKLLADTSDMSTLEFGAYMKLLLRAWVETPPGSLPDNDRVLARYAGLTPSEWSHSGPTLRLRFEPPRNGRITQKRMTSVYADLKRRAKEKSDAARQSAKCRWDKDNHAVALRTDANAMLKKTEIGNLNSNKTKTGGIPPNPPDPPPAESSKPQNRNPVDHPDVLEIPRKIAFESFDQWASCAPPLGIRRQLNPAANEHRKVAELVESESQLPPIIENGQQVKAHLLIPRAIDALKAKGKGFKSPAYAVACVRSELEDWRNGSGPIADDPIAQAKRVAKMHEQLTGAK